MIDTLPVPRPLAQGMVRVIGKTLIINEEDVHLFADEGQSSLIELNRRDGLTPASRI